MSCILHTTRSQTCLRNDIVELKNIQENKERHQGVIEASFGHKQSCTLATKTAEMVLRLLLCTTQGQPDSKARESGHVQSTTVIIGNNPFLNAVLLSRIPLCLKIPRKHF